MSYRGEVEQVSEMGRSFREWRIPDFLYLATEGVDGYFSRKFDYCGGEWWLVIRPNGLWHKSSSGWVHLYLIRADDEGPTLTINIAVGIKGAEGVEKKRERSHRFLANDPGCFWYRFCSKSELKEQKSRLLPENALTIHLDMEIDVPRIPTDSYTQTVEESKDTELLTEETAPSSEKQGIEKLSEDIGKLLVSEEDSDITVQVDTVEFKAHRSILSARCPVLSAMFRHDTEERASKRITIRDCEPNVFRDFLNYLYRGSAQNTPGKNVFELYRIADKYLADDLKQQCLNHVRKTLCVQTFCSAIHLALTYGEDDLFKQAMEFANENVRLILRSVEWQIYNRDHPVEATEILIKSLGPPS